MSFASPLVLLALVLVPALVGWYVAHQRARRREAAAFASPHLVPSVAPWQPGWRRHAPMAAFALALTVLVVAAAKPQRTVAVPVETASIMLATDVSRSMTATDVAPTRLVAARRAARRFVQGVPRGVRIGVMAFNSRPTVLQSPTRDHAAASAALLRLEPGGFTAIGEAINAGVRILNPPRLPGNSRPPAAIVLLSDGKSVRGHDPRQAAAAAKRARVPVYTVALGTPRGTMRTLAPDGSTRVTHVPPDPESLIQVARTSGGEAFTAADADQLKRVYERLGSRLGTERRKRELTSAFAGGALLVLLAGVAMSLGWFGRLV
jgi:Ca-activated chloride channel family protein